ncbi:hypothetical protein [Nocardioides sp. LHG3406-4]|uniref:hypothetical protein n=1 Tax=Nocardioides sp. LHG3406-4 TaxID=2804575 RepID=UPI003CF030E5
MEYDTTLENYIGTRHHGRLDHGASGSREMQVDLSELDGYVALVQRASDDLKAVKSGASSSVTQSDFGPILELMMGSYNSLVPKLHTALEEDGTRMADHAEALKATARDFTLTEAGVSQTYGGKSYDGRNGSTAFGDAVETTLARPRATQGELPKVSFGQPYDIVCDLIAMLTGFDIRAELAEKIGGDTVGASTQGSSWGSLGKSVSAVATNLEAGRHTVSGTWSGTASDSARNNMGQWVGMLDSQAGKMIEMGQNVVQICKDAWETAMCVVETIKSAVQAVSSALATMSIPGIGWARVVQACYQAFQALMKAFNVLKKFFNILKSVKSYIEMVKDFFNPDELPSATATA